MTAPTSPTEPDMNYDDDESMPPPDMELRRLAIKAGLTQPTPLDTFHDMAGALGFRQAGSAEARIAALEARVREAESDLAAARVTIGELRRELVQYQCAVKTLTGDLSEQGRAAIVARHPAQQ